MEKFFPMLESVAARKDLSLSAKVVHALLVRFSQMDGGAFPSQARIAQGLGISERTIGRATRELEKAGLVKVIHRGRGASCLYSIAALDKMSDRMDNLSGSDRQTVGTDTRQNVRLIEASLKEKEASASDAETLTHEERLDWFARTLENFNPDLGKPDSRIVTRIEAVVSAATESQIEACLNRLYDSGLPKRMRSWGILVKVLPEELGRNQ